MPKELPITEFDIFTLNEYMHMFKAMIPFFDFQTQKMLSIMIRMQEFQQTMYYYNNPANERVLTSQAADCLHIRSLNDLTSNEHFLQTILKYCPEEYKKIFSQIKTFSKMSDLIRFLPPMDNSSDMFQNPAILQFLSSMTGTGSSNPTENKTTPHTDSVKHENSANTDKPNAATHTQKTVPLPELFKNILTPKQLEEYQSYMSKLSDI